MRPLTSCLLGLVLCLATAGCIQSEYARSYHSTMGTPPPAPAQYRGINLVDYQGTPRIVQSNLGRQEQIHYLEEGWVPLGESDFYGPLESDGSLLDQAKKVGAELVLVSRVLGQTVQGATPYTTYEPVTIYNYGGRRGFRSFQTAIVPETNYMPYTENWYAQHAIYYTRRIQPPALGALSRDLTPDERKRLGFNAGVNVICCVRGTPAWNAGILPDDVVVSLAGQQVADVESLRNLVQQNAGKTVPLEYVRNGQRHTISITLGAATVGE